MLLRIKTSKKYGNVNKWAKIHQRALYIICFISTIHFGTRSAEKHRNMCWGDINLKVNGEGQEYLAFMERQTKTRTGENIRDIQKVTQKCGRMLKTSADVQLTLSRSIQPFAAI